jgi:hypothetical protein
LPSSKGIWNPSTVVEGYLLPRRAFEAKISSAWAQSVATYGAWPRGWVQGPFSNGNQETMPLKARGQPATKQTVAAPCHGAAGGGFDAGTAAPRTDFNRHVTQRMRQRSLLGQPDIEDFFDDLFAFRLEETVARARAAFLRRNRGGHWIRQEALAHPIDRALVDAKQFAGEFSLHATQRPASQRMQDLCDLELALARRS